MKKFIHWFLWVLVGFCIGSLYLNNESSKGLIQILSGGIIIITILYSIDYFKNEIK
jgi:hypothetical protein